MRIVENTCEDHTAVLRHTPPPHNLLQGRARGPIPLSLGARRVKQSCLTADIWFHSECGTTIPVRSKRSTHCDMRQWRGTKGGIYGGTWHGWYRGWYVVPLYTRHIVKYKMHLNPKVAVSLYYYLRS